MTRDGGRLRALDLATRYGDIKLTATGFVDATGDAALTWQAGFPCREHAEGPIYGTQMMVLEGIDEAHQPSREEFTKRARAKAAEYGLVRTDGFAFIFPGRGTALVNFTHVETPLDLAAALGLPEWPLPTDTKNIRWAESAAQRIDAMEINPCCRPGNRGSNRAPESACSVYRARLR